MTQKSKENSAMSNKNPLKFLRWGMCRKGGEWWGMIKNGWGMVGNDGEWLGMVANGGKLWGLVGNGGE